MSSEDLAVREAMMELRGKIRRYLDVFGVGSWASVESAEVVLMVMLEQQYVRGQAAALRAVNNLVEANRGN